MLLKKMQWHVISLQSSGTLDMINEVGQEAAGLSNEDLKSIYKYMVLTRTADSQAIILQRQGRISFYVSCEGEEASEVGSAFALKQEDWIFTDYRASGVVITRGLALTKFFAQLMGNSGDILKGRSMPSHWGSKKLNIVAPSSPICTQLPHAVGVGLGAVLRGDRIATIAYFGDGGTSSNDFHSALNFAAIFKTPTIFFCRNNGYAISVPVSRQTASQTLASKAAGYNIEGIRVDGNDPLAVYSVTNKALEKARAGGGPTLIEAVTYRLGAHSTSDDPTKYRDHVEVEQWKKRDPLVIFRSFLEKKGFWNQADDLNTKESATKQVKAAILDAERMSPVTPESIVDDVYSTATWNLKRQVAELQKEIMETKS